MKVDQPFIQLLNYGINSLLLPSSLSLYFAVLELISIIINFTEDKGSVQFIN